MNKESQKYEEILNVFKSSWSNQLTLPEVQIVESQDSRTVKFAMSELRNFSNFEIVKAWRNLERSDSKSWESTSVSIKRRKWIHMSEIEFPRGEDPRLFKHQNEVYAMVQKFNEDLADISITLINMTSGERTDLISPLGFNGKNWVPISVQNDLYFAYSLDPVVIQKLDAKTQRLELLNKIENFAPKWDHDLEKSIGLIRGGTPALYQSDVQSAVGFSHSINPEIDLHAHRMGVYLLNFSTRELKHVYLTNYFPGLLVDSYGLQEVSGHFVVDGTMALGDIHEQDSRILNFRFRFSKREVLDLLCNVLPLSEEAATK